MDQQVFPPRRLAGAERDILDDPVALVEHPEHRDPLGHRGDPGDLALARRRAGTIAVRAVLVGAAPAGGEREDAAKHQESCPAHAYSGIQGS
ncbi:MAG: hypothetical protein ACREBM_07780 [Sphingomicrobium sp.]